MNEECIWKYFQYISSLRGFHPMTMPAKNWESGKQTKHLSQLSFTLWESCWIWPCAYPLLCPESCILIFLLEGRGWSQSGAQRGAVDTCPVWLTAKWRLCGGYGAISPWLPNFADTLKGPTGAIFYSINTSFIFWCAETTSFDLGVTECVSCKERQRLRWTERGRRR